MAESLSAEQIEERRTNLRAFRAPLMMVDDSELTTTLLMQEEWLATIDASEAHTAGITKQLRGYARDAHTLRGLRTRKCLLSDTISVGETCTDFWRDKKLYCAPCYLRAIHEPAPTMRIEIAPSEPEEPLPKILPLSKFKDVSEYQGGIPKVQEWVEDTECDIQGHIWIKMGKVGLGEHGLSAVDWGDPRCLRCGIPEQEPDVEDCCLSHSCPHHDGMQKDGNDEWYNPNDPTDGRYRPDR